MYSLEAIFVMYCDVASHFHKIYFKSYEARQNIELAYARLHYRTLHAQNLQDSNYIILGQVII